MATDISQQGSGRSPPSGSSLAGLEPAAAPARQHPPRGLARLEGAESLERGLGWFSIGLGAAAVAAPRLICWLSGSRSPVIMRLVGARELAAGIGILTQSNREPWLWSRVAGDVFDLAALSVALAGRGRRGRAAVALAAVAGVTALDVLAAARLTGARAGQIVPGVSGRTDIYLERSIAVSKSPEECYRFWRSFENLPRFMHSLESVRQLDERRSRWVAKGPMASRLEWTSEITSDRPGEELAWRTLDDSGAANAGSVRFEAAPAGRGTIVRVSLHYSPLGGALGAGLVKLLGHDPQSRIREDLRRFKQVMETGEIPTTRGQPTGRRSLFGRVTQQWGLTS
ncbi:MAG TPA: SRPBCC family protein [Steroidobacteraceae bacterium]|nr:SRPBCC family protein [Steroidobacteraceae bacterium]